MIFRRCGYLIRPARRGDLHLLPKIEVTAASRFAPFGLGETVLSSHLPLELLDHRQHEGRLWVAANRKDRAIGFATASIVDGVGHLDELSVLPRYGRRGIGSQLVAKVCAWAEAYSMRAVTLSTFLEVPWNAPFYERLSFRILEPAELTLGLRLMRDAEAQAGLPIERRVFMKRNV